MSERCEPPPEWRERIARAIHEGLGNGWAYCNYGMLDGAADKVLAIVTPPATVAALVEALENLMDVQAFATGWDNGVTDATGTMNEGDHWHGLAMNRARAALALYREEG